MTCIPIHIPPRPQPKPWCYICGNPCIDAGDRGRLVRWVGRRVRACWNCREENDLNDNLCDHVENDG